VANEIRIAVAPLQLEVPVVRREPRIDNFRDGEVDGVAASCNTYL